MVYTSAGAFKAVALFPGNYELTVKARGLESDPQKPRRQGRRQSRREGGDARRQGSRPVSDLGGSVAGAELANGVAAAEEGRSSWPATTRSIRPGPGRVVLETLCMNCHGENFFPSNPRSAQGWKFGARQDDGQEPRRARPAQRSAKASSPASASAFRFGLQDRKDVLEYLTKNFGLDKKPRAVKTDKRCRSTRRSSARRSTSSTTPSSDEKEAARRPASRRRRRFREPRPRRRRRPHHHAGHDRRAGQPLGRRSRRAQPARQARSAHRRAEGVGAARHPRRRARHDHGSAGHDLGAGVRPDRRRTRRQQRAPARS